jgi:fructose-1,6-bisphosphatase/inositol monophosphatase family enzyme
MNDINRLTEAGIRALKRAYEVHEELGERGLEAIQKNPYGETSLAGDIEIEKAVIEVLKKEELPLRILSEEHGQVNISDNPQFLGVLDGLDGTEVYRKSRGVGRYATMFGIFLGMNPEYRDYLFSGVIEHSSERLYYAVKKSGGALVEGRKYSPLRCSSIRRLENAKIYADEFFDEYAGDTLVSDTFLSKLKGFNFLHEHSSAVRYVDLVQGKADLVLEFTRKGNLEVAVAFGLVNEARGVMFTADGKDIGEEKYLTFGQDRHIPIISASSPDLARELISKIQ